MKTGLKTRRARCFLAAVVLALASGSASAGDGVPLKCYDKVLMSAKLKVWKELVTPAREQYEHRNGQVQLVRYPAIYVERVEELEPPYLLLRERPCKR